MNMNLLLHGLLLLLLGCFATNESRTPTPPPRSPVPPPPVQPTYYSFALQWPKAWCKIDGNCANEKQLPLYFTIHGLWPEVKPACLQPVFNAGVFKNPAGLADYWPNITSLNTKYATIGNYYFWGHEWNDHGRCQLFRPVNEYFRFVLDLYKSDQVTRIRDEIQRFQGGLVLTTTIRHLIQTNHHVSIAFRCKEALVTKESLLHEVVFNVSLSGQLQDMDIAKENCSRTTRVKFL